MYSKEITVFTPTYNRAYIIKNLYDSLIRQTFTDFEWLVVDDGSTDHTEKLIKEFILEKRVEIRYFKKENGGKHTATNKGIEEAHGRIFFIVDSDDHLKVNALERIIYWEKTLEGQEKFAGVSGLRCYPDETVIGEKWMYLSSYIDATILKKKKYHLTGDKAEAYYTDILKKFYPIPVYEGENDVEIGVLWNRIGAGGYMIRWFDESLYVCEYLDDGLSKNSTSNHFNNFKGYTCWKKELADLQKSYYGVIRELSSFTEVAHRKGLTVKEMCKEMQRWRVTVYLAQIHFKLHLLKNKRFFQK